MVTVPKNGHSLSTMVTATPTMVIGPSNNGPSSPNNGDSPSTMVTAPNNVRSPPNHGHSPPNNSHSPQQWSQPSQQWSQPPHEQTQARSKQPSLTLLIGLEILEFSNDAKKKQIYPTCYPKFRIPRFRLLKLEFKNSESRILESWGLVFKGWIPRFGFWKFKSRKSEFRSWESQNWNPEVQFSNIGI